MAHDDQAMVIRRSRIRLVDLSTEVTAGILQRPGRAVLTALGTVLGIGAFVAVLGLTASAQGQISDRFTAQVATEVMIEDTGTADAFTEPAFPPDADRRVRRINGVSHAGVWWQVEHTPPLPVTGVSLPGVSSPKGLSVYATTAGFLEAVRPRMLSGRLYDEGHDSTGARVVVLGAGAARQLGVRDLQMRPAVFIDDIPFTVIGVIEDVARQPELLSSVMVPRRTVEEFWGEPAKAGQAKMLVETRAGAAQVVARQVAIALRPEAADRFKVIPPPDPRQLRDQVDSDLNTLFLILAGLCLIVGAVGIANTTMVAVLERTSEIGIRRALGARRRHIAAQFLSESGVVGLLGGLVGTSLGVLTVVLVAVAKNWTPVMPIWTAAAAPILGGIVGVLAGAYPAIRAARIQPVEALRR
ncbi:ABC transporter permease [Actinoplanes sp. NPDC051346]|uniref:ABC transporter permease n=1 Tax=Actinoplanes sp. NPDC051346 TaxID=3155048 RepID=UPI00341D67F7